MEQLDENARLMYQIYPVGALWYNHDDQPASTMLCKSNGDGEGYALFVASFKGEVFIHGDEEGFHYSTFLAGGAVLPAGSIKIKEGDIRIFTGQSGHDQPTPENMRKFVTQVEEIPGDAAIWPDFAKKKVFHRVADDRKQGPAAPVMTAKDVDLVDHGPSTPGIYDNQYKYGPTAYGKYT